MEWSCGQAPTAACTLRVGAASCSSTAVHCLMLASTPVRQVTARPPPHCVSMVWLLAAQLHATEGTGTQLAPALCPCPAEHQVHIMQELQDACVQEGDNAVFMCEVSHGDVLGEWFRDGEKIKVSSTVKIRQEGTVPPTLGSMPHTPFWGWECGNSVCPTISTPLSRHTALPAALHRAP